MTTILRVTTFGATRSTDGPARTRDKTTFAEAVPSSVAGIEATCAASEIENHY